MKHLTSFLLLPVLCVAASAQEPDLAEGKKAFNRGCANCHFVPDASIQRDRVWTGLIETTA